MVDKEVMFYTAFVCLSVYQQDDSEMTWKVVDQLKVVMVVVK